MPRIEWTVTFVDALLENLATRVLVIHGSTEELAAFVNTLPTAVSPDPSPDLEVARSKERLYWPEVLGEDPDWVESWLNFRRRG